MDQKVQLFADKIDEAFKLTEAKYSQDLFSKIFVVQLGLKYIRNSCTNLSNFSQTPQHDLHFVTFTTNSGVWSEDKFLIDPG